MTTETFPQSGFDEYLEDFKGAVERLNPLKPQLTRVGFEKKEPEERIALREGARVGRGGEHVRGRTVFSRPASPEQVKTHVENIRKVLWEKGVTK